MAKLLSATLVISAAGMASAYTVVAMDGFMFKNIDPIVHPGEYNSHLHTFFGSDAVTINTTTSEELKTGCTTAENLNDHSVYCKHITSLIQTVSKLRMFIMIRDPVTSIHRIWIRLYTTLSHALQCLLRKHRRCRDSYPRKL